MNEPKYKAWLKQENIMVPVQQIHFYDRTISYIYDDYRNGEQNWLTEDFEDVELMLYSELLDNKENEIFNGFIIAKEGHPNYYVAFEFGSFVCISTNKIQANSWEHYLLKDMLAIGFVHVGNIFENKDLMEVE